MVSQLLNEPLKKDPSVASLVTDQEKMTPVVASAWLGLVL